MESNKNIFYATNPAKMMDALAYVLDTSGVDLADMLIFLPSRRAVRGVEKYLVARAGHSIILPRLVALGEAADEQEFNAQDDEKSDSVSDTLRVLVTAKLLAEDKSIGNLATALPVAHDLLRMQNYLENEGIDAAAIDWMGLVDEKYAAHFQRKAKILSILSQVQNEISDNRPTVTQKRNADIRAWIGLLDKYKLVVVCASTASVPATADLMVAVARAAHGRIIMSGHISGDASDFELHTNPYNAEYKFLSRIGVRPVDLIPIDVGTSPIEFFNHAFSNNPSRAQNPDDVQHCHLIVCDRESEEAAAVAEIAARAVRDNKSVLVITPDAAGNQRIASAFATRGLMADLSQGVPGTMMPAGRAILNLFDDWIECEKSALFDSLYAASDYDLMNVIINLVDEKQINFMPAFDVDDAASCQIWQAVDELSECVKRAGIVLTLADARALLADVISGVQVRQPMCDTARIIVLGTIESRMQTADVVILTGLNDGMFPARGYENDWLPLAVAEQIGLPSPDRKVSLQSLDFMNLSCGPEVYWMRSATAGGVKTTASRFLSRVIVRRGAFDVSKAAADILGAVRGRDVVDARPLDYSPPSVDQDWGDVYVTELELLIHNPYAFYVRHMLRLRVLDDYWMGPDVRDFGNLVHSVIETTRDFSVDNLVRQMDARALEMLGTDSVLFHFWHRRFVEIAPVISDFMAQIPHSVAEVPGKMVIDGHVIRARADRVWDGGVMDIKTGAAPSKSQLFNGNMPQLPIEAYMLKNGGFSLNVTEKSNAPVMKFLQLKHNDACVIDFDAATTQQMMNAAFDKVKEMIDIFLVGGAPYEYRQTKDIKYKIYDDFARVDD